jgi:amino-acid N-acetyltransferase
MEDVAVATAIALDADKLIFLTELPGMQSASGEVLSEISEANARELLASKDALQPSEAARGYLSAALRAAEGGVERSHLVPFDTDGSLLLELFLHDGVGSMVVEETLEALREATIDDVGGILSIIRPLEDDGTLVRREPGTVERDIERFSVIEHDGVIFGCAALFPFPESSMGEMACVAVNPGAQGQGDGERLLRHIEQRARAAGLKRLFVLTTRTMHWFLKRGFVQVTPDELPAQRRGLYDKQRNSQVLMKDLSSPTKDIAV